MDTTTSLPSSASQSDTRVYLQIGERTFITSASTLTDGSDYFTSAFSGRWQNPQSSADHPYFIDADPDVFAHTLRYLRHKSMPIFYKQSDGFDYGLYHALQKQAGYFGIGRLENWIKEQGYLRAVTVQYSVENMKWDTTKTDHDVTVEGNKEVEYVPFWSKEKVYQCPRGIGRHTEFSNCGRDCRRALGEDDDGYVEENVLRTLSITKRVIFNNNMAEGAGS